MRVRILRSCDAIVDGVKRALWQGQFYELPADAVKYLVQNGLAEHISNKPAGPPEDKAAAPRETKRP